MKASARYYAHSLLDAAEDRWQPLADHLRAVAELARVRGEKFGAGRAAALAGVLHDLGKYTRSFQARLAGGDKVDHSTAGAQEVGKLARSGIDRGVAELIAYGIAGHHAGLPDKMGGDSSLDGRLQKMIEAPDPVWREEISPNANDMLPRGFISLTEDRNRLSFQFSLLARMIFSMLVDADFRDTEAFYAAAEGWTPGREWPALAARVEELLVALGLAGTG